MATKLNSSSNFFCAIGVPRNGRRAAKAGLFAPEPLGQLEHAHYRVD
jgi:hypothetical protein